MLSAKHVFFVYTWSVFTAIWHGPLGFYSGLLNFVFNKPGNDILGDTQGSTKFQSFIRFPVQLYLGLFIFLTNPALYLSFIAFLSNNILPPSICRRIFFKIVFREGWIEAKQFYFALFIRFF
jgi:hypothetical protein